MITFYVGTPGSGKSYDAVRVIVDNLRLGRVVCTNIDGMDDYKCFCYLKSYSGFAAITDFEFRKRFRFLTTAEVKSFWRTETVVTPLTDGDVLTEQLLICPVGSLIVLDEVHKHFNSRDWNLKASELDKQTISREMGDWASTHRHQGYDLILITQSIDKVDKQIRSLTEWTYFYRKVNFLGALAKNRYFRYAYSGDDHDGKSLSKLSATYDSAVFPCYKSYASSDAKEVGFMKHVNILKHPVFFAIPVVICLCLYFFSKSSLATGDIFGTEKVRKRYDTMRKTSVAALPPAAPVAAAVAMNNYSSAGVQNDSPVEQKTVTGYYQDAGLYHVLYSDGSVVKTQIRPVVDQSPRSVAVASAFRQVASASGVSPVLPPSGRLMDGPVDVVNVHHGVKRGEFGGLE